MNSMPHWSHETTAEVVSSSVDGIDSGEGVRVIVLRKSESNKYALCPRPTV